MATKNDPQVLEMKIWHTRAKRLLSNNSCAVMVHTPLAWKHFFIYRPEKQGAWIKANEIRKIFFGPENQLHEIVCRETANTEHGFGKGLTD